MGELKAGENQTSFVDLKDLAHSDDDSGLEEILSRLESHHQSVSDPTHFKTDIIDGQDRPHLLNLFEQLLLPYLDPIAQYVRVFQRNEHSSETVDGFRELLGPVNLLTKSLQVQPVLEIIDEIREILDEPSLRSGHTTYRMIAPFTSLFERLLGAISPEARERYLSQFYYQRNSIPLLEDLRRIRYIGPKRLQRIYAAGLITAEAISRAKPSEIADVTGLPLKLAEQVVIAGSEYHTQQRQRRCQRIGGLASDLREELHNLTRDGSELPDHIRLQIQGLREYLKVFTPESS